MADTTVPAPALSSQPTNNDSNVCPHRQGPACPLCAVTDELIRIFNRPSLTTRLLKHLAR